MNDQQTQLLESLLTRTNEGKVDWKKTAENDSFQAVVGEHIIAVTRRPRVTSPDYLLILSIFNSDGDAIENFSILSPEFMPVGEITTTQNMLAELFERARRRAHGAEQAIDAILQELNS